MQSGKRKSGNSAKTNPENVEVALRGGQSCPFRWSKLPFYTLKVALLQGDRASITALFKVKNAAFGEPATDYQAVTNLHDFAEFEAEGELAGKYRAVEDEKTAKFSCFWTFGLPPDSE